MIDSILRWILLDLLFELFEAIFPKKVRKIIGIILLSIGVLGLSFAWFESQGLDQNDPWSGFGVMLIGIFSLFPFLLGAVILIQTIEPPHIVDIEKEEYITPESDITLKKQIDCTSCNQLLNIAFSYTGMISCPACGIHIKLDEGIIQNEM
jgi:hypothetical protein